MKLRWWLIIVVVFLACRSGYNRKYEPYVNHRIEAAAAAGELKMIVDIDIDQTEYHSLGSDITMWHKCNGTLVKSGDSVPAKGKMSFSTKIIEEDSVDDVGTGDAVLYVPWQNKTTSTTTHITVREAGGRRYPDAYASWDVTYSVRPDLKSVGRIGVLRVLFFDVDEGE